MPFREVRIRPVNPAQLAPVIGPARMRELADTIRGASLALGSRTVVNVNSTAVGGGVAELLETLLGYARGGGVATRWFVVEGDAAFFDVTKRIHNGLYGSSGDGGQLGTAEAKTYERTLRANAREIDGRVHPGDIVILHDPQTAGLAPAFRRLGATIVWRCHVGSDQSNEWTERSWGFLRPYLEDVDAFVFSRRRFAPEWADAGRLHVILPSITPFSTKNMHLTGAQVRAMLNAAGLIDGPGRARTAEFRRASGRRGVVRHRAAVVREGGPPPLGAPLVVQISRWDRMKDMAGVMAGFAGAFDPSLGAHLILAGPQADGVEDDPEAAQVFGECRAQWEALPAAVRRHVHLANLPTADHDENAAITNALQRRASVVCQKSLAEGFGLTVTEAMWKGRAVVASAVGGIVDQIRGPQYGILLDDPRNLTEFAGAVNGLLRTPSEARRLGANARRFATRHMLTDRHLQRYAELIQALDGRR
ncbi:MAG TPA: glycosyltransferase [Gaiellales bacterium]|nr:glycosyltransferase [Gaiellales bacterium]